MSFFHENPFGDGETEPLRWVLSSVQLVVFALALFLLALVSYASV